MKLQEKNTAREVVGQQPNRVVPNPNNQYCSQLVDEYTLRQFTTTIHLAMVDIRTIFEYVCFFSSSSFNFTVY
jgi:hypothetical protein